MGLKKGEKPERLGQIRVVDVRREPLDGPYSIRESIREGFALSWPEFVEMFCRHMKCTSETVVTRIEFEYIDLASDCPDFKFVELNPRRKARGVESARVEVDGEWMWMSKYDIEANMRDFGPHPELVKALESYK
jgi:hypothetical protein